ncbi:conserved hypothetical protein [Trichinella spiralis]|uniref:hypothetical protein n=1 Tax=Trichinella spiralis TaxID=6334 RepID=UPI0001EFBD72|nr:conserved hypothetical protein [Trichinella spiralis]
MEKKAILRKPSAEVTKLIHAIYDKEASDASSKPFTSGQFPGLLASGDFHLHKWISNEPEVLKSVLDEKDPDHLLNTLIIYWECEGGLEKLNFSPPLMVHGKGEDSKRKPLNTAFHIFDPVGCFAPFTVRAKMLLQIFWQAGASWDDPLPRDVKEQWTRWKNC